MRAYRTGTSSAILDSPLIDQDLYRIAPVRRRLPAASVSRGTDLRISGRPPGAPAGRWIRSEPRGTLSSRHSLGLGRRPRAS